MRILHTASECAPIVKVGGLGDVVGSLPKFQAGLGVEVGIALPYYRKVKEADFPVKERDLVKVNFRDKESEVRIWEGRLPGSEVPVYLFANEEYLSDGPYDKADFSAVSEDSLENTRFEFFSMAVATWLEKEKFDIVHGHDKHSCHLLAEIKRRGLGIKTILTIHNLANKGSERTGLAAGIGAADLVTTVSPQYAKEIQTGELGCGLEGILGGRAKEGKLVGILNGIDTKVWDPRSDQYLENRLEGSVDNFKAINEQRLIERLGFDSDVRLPLYAFVGRLTDQKGVEILVEAWEEFTKETHAHLVVLGTGQEEYRREMTDLEVETDEFFGRPEVTFINRFNEELAHEIYAASDFLLIPSKFEPCGLTQMVAMRYGTLPIARDTGGLHDSIRDGETGFLFRKYSSQELLEALRRSVRIIGEPAILRMMREKATAEDFSWDRSAKRYLELYNSV